MARVSSSAALEVQRDRWMMVVGELRSGDDSTERRRQHVVEVDGRVGVRADGHVRTARMHTVGKLVRQRNTATTHRRGAHRHARTAAAARRRGVLCSHARDAQTVRISVLVLQRLVLVAAGIVGTQLVLVFEL